MPNRRDLEIASLLPIQRMVYRSDLDRLARGGRGANNAIVCVPYQPEGAPLRNLVMDGHTRAYLAQGMGNLVIRSEILDSDRAVRRSKATVLRHFETVEDVWEMYENYWRPKLTTKNGVIDSIAKLRVDER